MVAQYELQSQGFWFCYAITHSLISIKDVTNWITYFLSETSSSGNIIYVNAHENSNNIQHSIKC